MQQQLTTKDLEAIQHAVRVIVHDEVQKSNDTLRADFAQLQSSVDGYFKQTQDWRQEFEVLRAQHNRLKEVLLEKGLATEEELAVISLN